MSTSHLHNKEEVVSQNFGRSMISVLNSEKIDNWVKKWKRNKTFLHLQFVRKSDKWKTFFFPSKQKIITSSDLVLLYKGKGRRPHSAFSLFINLLSAIEHVGGSLYILGGSTELLSVVYQNVQQTFPQLRIIGKFCGKLDHEMEHSVLTAIRKAEPDLLFLGNKMKNGNKWLQQKRTELPQCLAVWSQEIFLRISGVYSAR